MKVGDLVKKVTGGQTGEVGVILEKVVNSYDKGPITILIVMVGNETKKWYSDYVEVIDEKTGD